MTVRSSRECFSCPGDYRSQSGFVSRPEAVREPSGSRPETVGPVADAEAQQEELPAAPVPAGAGDAREGEGGGDCGVDAFQEYCRSIELPLDTLTARNFRRRFGPRSEFSDHQRYCAACFLMKDLNLSIRAACDKFKGGSAVVMPRRRLSLYWDAVSSENLDALKRLGLTKAEKLQLNQVPRGCGRWKVTPQMYEMLHQFVLWSARAGRSLSAAAIGRSVLGLRYMKEGVIKQENDLAVLDVEQYVGNTNMYTLYRGYRDWTKAHKPKAEWMRVHASSSEALAKTVACTPSLVSKMLSDFEELLLETGIMDPETKTLIRPQLLVAVDEKGYSGRQVSKVYGVGPSCLQKGRRKADLESGNIKHVSVLGIASAAGVSLGPGVVVSGKMVNRQWSKSWPGAFITTSESGNVSGEAFVQLLRATWLERLSAADQKAKKVLLLDTGGGQMPHVSISMWRLCVEYEVYPFYLASNTTHAMMPLDQQIHRQCQATWSRLRAASGHANGSVSTEIVFEMVAHAHKEGFTFENIISSWKRCGIGRDGLDRNELLTRRAPELFPLLGQPGPLHPAAKGTPVKALFQAESMNLARDRAVRCVARTCHKKIKTSEKYCKYCGIENPKYDNFDVEGVKWHLPVQLAQVDGEPENDDEVTFGRYVGNLRKRIRGKSAEDLLVPAASSAMGANEEPAHAAAAPLDPSAAESVPVPAAEAGAAAVPARLEQPLEKPPPPVLREVKREPEAGRRLLHALFRTPPHPGQA